MEEIFCTLKLWVEPAKEIILTIAAIIGVVVAFVGLRTWRKQLKGNTEYELARRFLHSVYRTYANLFTNRSLSLLLLLLRLW